MFGRVSAVLGKAGGGVVCVKTKVDVASPVVDTGAVGVSDSVWVTAWVVVKVSVAVTLWVVVSASVLAGADAGALAASPGFTLITVRRSESEIFSGNVEYQPASRYDARLIP